ncbi:MAG: multicopper oxidase domain-containing protein [Desulfobulbaceae bacterium]|nr:multicopper oxidase domain-containing protein [Desulfobulbaceae bacterium]
MAMAVSALAWSGGISHAYLKADKSPIGPLDTPDYLSTPNWANSPQLRKFVDLLPGVAGLTTYNTQANGYNADGTTNLGQQIYIAVPDITSYPGSDYYVIQLDDYFEQMHTDLTNPTKQRGYHQTNNGTNTAATEVAACLALPPVDQTPCLTGLVGNFNTITPPPGPHHLGPIIVAQKDRPVRVKFVNHLGAGSDGDLFLPVDTSIPGAGQFTVDYDPITKTPVNPPLTGTFSQNRATLHLHGGTTPWISDGTPHQWITPATEVTDYPQGVSTKNVPDMAPPEDGAQTFYWTNQQSARLLFYHDHAYGITRLNVYAGEAAGYLIQDPTEIALINAGIIPADQIPLVIEDKTFVDPDNIGTTDPTWNWGSGPLVGGIRQPVKGDLWWPHVYMPAQNPYDITGIAPMGRWAYGPWFWPPTVIQFPPIDNPYYGADCDPSIDTQTVADTQGLTILNGVHFCQPPYIPATPTPSWGAEAFMDTPLVNGTAYPVLKVEPKAYRLRILNASHDRFYNLMLAQADVAPGAADCIGVAGSGLNCADNSEIRVVPSVDYTAMLPTDPAWPSVVNPVTLVSAPQPDTWAMDGRTGGVPDWNMTGPDWIQIGSEGGFLPKPVVIKPNPVIWNMDPTTFNVGNVSSGSLILGSAERADVIVDFSPYAGRTLLLYNDAPAPFPALDPHYDYFNGAADMTEAGGMPPSKPGLGPNTRTIMQIQVAGGPGVPFTAEQMTKLNDAFATGNNSVGGASLTPTGLPVFAESQHPIIVGQTAYNGIYAEGTPADPTPNSTFPGVWPYWGVAGIGDNTINYEDVAGKLHGDLPGADYPAQYMEPKAIHDEMGAVFDDYGRLSAKLGLEMAKTNGVIQTFVMQNYADPSTEILNPGEVQVWKVTHNGVDTHPLHFHLYDIQVINRVGWDGFRRLPFENEFGWKDTVRISPLEDTIIALRPITPLLPFGIPESIRPLNPIEPLGSTVGFTTIDPYTGQARNPAVFNKFVNYDWEYVVHCHILSHEENDMMRTQAFLFKETLPPYVGGLLATPAGADIDLTWSDPTPATALLTQGNAANEIGFIIERAVGTGPFATLTEVPANRTSYTDVAAPAGSRYRVIAYNAAGESTTPDSLGLFRPSLRTWYQDMNGNGTYNAGVDTAIIFGQTTDIPLVGDWDGDGKSEFGLYRSGTWYLDMNGNGVWNGAVIDKQISGFGTATDLPVVGDWNGDGISDIGFFRPGIRNFFLDTNGNGVWNAGVDRQTQLGQVGDKPVVGDWTGDGIDKVGVFRPSTRMWYLDTNNNGLYDVGVDQAMGPYGQPTDIPVVGDWTATGIDRIGVYRTGMWYLDSNNTGIYDAGVDLALGNFGQPTDKPVVGKW